MSRRPTPIFLERRSYRLRRVMDAARLMPVVGAALWLVPTLWPKGDEAASVPTSRAILYVFLVWIVLAGVTWFLSRWLDDGADTEGRQDR